jgi:hypothetical protein
MGTKDMSAARSHIVAIVPKATRLVTHLPYLQSNILPFTSVGRFRFIDRGCSSQIHRQLFN